MSTPHFDAAGAIAEILGDVISAADGADAALRDVAAALGPAISTAALFINAHNVKQLDDPLSTLLGKISLATVRCSHAEDIRRAFE